MNWDSICYDAGAFTAGLFLLEYGADRFIDHTAIVARQLGVSQTLVALLTVGAEWEELAVVVASILQGRSSIALGNVIGSSISNILGAFSLGLLCHPGRIAFDRSAKIYTALLFLVTSNFTVVALTENLGRLAGGIFIGVFALYLVSVGCVIYKGMLSAPEDLDSDNSDDDGRNGAEVQHDHPPAEITPLLFNNASGEHSAHALALSGYVLSHSAASIADAFDLSGTVLGVTVLSFATILPEKFVAVISGTRGHGGIVVASTAGSNIFLLTLCLGITFVAGNQKELADSLIPFELLVTWVSSALLLLIVLLGPGRWIGGMLLIL